MKGYVQVYTGHGKGKTTAALGLVVRACGAGLRVCFCQFMKCGRFSEIKTLRARFPEVCVKQYGTGCFVRGKPSRADIAAARRGLRDLKKKLLSGKYDLVIADEICTAVSCGLFPVRAVMDLVERKPEDVELVFTGRDVQKCLAGKADLVTEMKSIKRAAAWNTDCGTAVRH